MPALNQATMMSRDWSAQLPASGTEGARCLRAFKLSTSSSLAPSWRYVTMRPEKTQAIYQGTY